MHQTAKHTEPPPNSKAAAYGYGAYASTTNKARYIKSSETGYTYFGARYYDSGLSVWLSVDPMADKYPSTSPFAYVENNPIMFVDPNGMLKDWYENEEGQLLWTAESKDEVTFSGETYTNLNKGSDVLPDEKKNSNGANLFIAGQNGGNFSENDDKTWQQQTENTANSVSNGKTNILVLANSSEDLIKAFEVTTSEFGSVNMAFIRSHAYGGYSGNFALNLGQTFEDDFSSSDITLFASKLGTSIKFSKGAIFYFMGCNSQELSSQFSLETGISSIGSIGGTGPNNPNGEWHAESAFYLNFSLFYLRLKMPLNNSSIRIGN